MMRLPEDPASPLRILLVDDDDLVRTAFQRALTTAGMEVTPASDGEAAVRLLEGQPFDALVSDIMMPGMSGLELLRRVRTRDLDVPVILMTGLPLVESAAEAVEYGALRYLTKPLPPNELVDAVRKAGQLARVARTERAAQHHLGGVKKLAADRAGLEASFQKALDGLKILFQPIISVRGRKVVAYEGLVRSSYSALSTPMLLLDAAERLDDVHRLGRAIRAKVAELVTRSGHAQDTYVNLHPHDLADDELLSADAPLSKLAPRVVLEVTERHALANVPELRDRISALRKLGYRIAVDDLGAGYAGLSSFAQLEPQVVKLDMSLVRNADAEPTKRKLIGSMVTLCRDLGLEVICEGVETVAERDALIGLGCDLLQGYLFARPAAEFAQLAL